MILRPFSDWREAESHEEYPKSYCSKCDITFAENNAYLDHFSDNAFHKLNTKEINIFKSTYYRCDICSLTRKGIVSLFRHCKKVHKVHFGTRANNEENPTNQTCINKKDLNEPKLSKETVKGSIDTTKSSVTKEGSQPDPVNKTKAKHILATKHNIRRSTRIHSTKAPTKTEPKRCKPRTRQSMVTRATNSTSPGLAKIDPRRICQFCNKVLSQPGACKKHIERKHKALSTSKIVESVSVLPKKKDRNVKCVICGQICTSKLLDAHFNNNHKIETAGKLCMVNKLHCELGDIEFRSSLELKNHMKKIHRLIKDEKFYCTVCNMAFKSRHGYNWHSVSNHHKKNTLALKNTTTASSNRSPMSSQEASTEVEEKDDVLSSKNSLNRDHCNACNITFYNKSSSLMHFFKIHKSSYKEVPEKEVYERRPNLNMLLKNEIVPKENDPNLYCNVCCKKFCNEGNFKLHLVSIHEMVLKKDKTEPVESNVSDREAFGSNSSLYYCNICNGKFVSEKSSQEHILMVHRVKKRKTGVSFSNVKTTKRSRVTKVT